MAAQNQDELPQMQRLIHIMARLRDKETGCPWDIEQTPKSLAPYCLEEAYEVVDAIETNNQTALKEELGDLLLQVVFHAQIAAEDAHFTFEQIAQGICEKMIRRHPHIFGDVAVADGQDVHANWENIKAEERAHKQTDPSLLADVPKAFPSLLRAQKLQKRAARVGFDWPQAEPVYAKVHEELEEVRTATSHAHHTEEIGDLLFAVVNLARHYNVEAEEALRAANHKFEKRFRFIEKNTSKPLPESTLEEMEALWQQAKQA